MFNLENRIHINFSMEKASDGSIIRSTILVNLYENDIDSAIELYQELKKRLKDHDIAERSGNEQVGSFPFCPEHHCKMILRTRRDGTGYFFGCPMYNQGCKKTLPYPIVQNTSIEMSSVKI